MRLLDGCHEYFNEEEAEKEEEDYFIYSKRPMDDHETDDENNPPEADPRRTRNKVRSSCWKRASH